MGGAQSTHRIRVGTASWSDPGFVEHWYPADIRATERLSFYAEFFDLVEVNSTFYRIPEASTVRRWCRETPQDFKFDIKLHRLFSWHSTQLQMLPPELRPVAQVLKNRVKLEPRIANAAAKAFLTAVRPLKAEGKLGALLLQLSPAFSKRHHQLAELDPILEPFAGETIAVELRNRGWVEPDQLARTRSFFRDRGIAFVMVDGPDDPHFMVMPSIDMITSPRLAYIRAHGRNASGYVRGRTVPDRFDYEYTEPELKQIKERTLKAASEAQEVHVVCNNNKADYAPRAASKFKQMIAEDTGLQLQTKEIAHA